MVLVRRKAPRRRENKTAALSLSLSAALLSQQEHFSLTELRARWVLLCVEEVSIYL